MSLSHLPPARRTLLGVAVASAYLLLAVPAGADTRAPAGRRLWAETWAASPQQQVLFPGLPGLPSAPSFRDQTIRHVLRVSVGGPRLQVRLTNEFGDEPLRVGAVHVARAAEDGAAVPGTDRVVTFGGRRSFAIPARAPALSDSVDLRVGPLESLAVSVYLPGKTGPATWHFFGAQTAYVASGDRTGATRLPGAGEATSRFFVSGVEVLVPGSGGTVVTLGDSITDGTGSTVDADHRWPDVLAGRLQARPGFRDLAVANEGIDGNRLLSENVGPSALARFDRDVLSRPGVRYATVLIGINDIGYPVAVPGEPTRTAGQLIAGYRQLIARAHERGVRIFGATLLPFEGGAYFSAAGEATREAVNRWIRTGGAYDGVIDFEAVTRDPSHPTRLRPEYDSGDHLHLNDAGYEAMGRAVDLRLFTLPPFPGGRPLAEHVPAVAE